MTNARTGPKVAFEEGEPPPVTGPAPGPKANKMGRGCGCASCSSSPRGATPVATESEGSAARVMSVLYFTVGLGKFRGGPCPILRGTL